MNTQKTNPLAPFLILTFIYFIVGFMTTINEQLQAPLKFAFLANAGSLKNTFITLISFFFGLGYLVNGRTGSRWVNAFGYKSTIIRGLLIMVLGLLVYLFSSWIGYKMPDATFSVGNSVIPYGFLAFVIGSFLIGSAAAIIQVVVNPYAASCQLRGTQPVQRLNILTGINSIGTTSAPFFVTLVIFSGVSIQQVEISQLLFPLSIMILCVLAVVLITKRLPIPDIENTRAVAGEKLERSIWSFRHFTLGVLAIFFYVGTEVAIGANVNLHAIELMESGHSISFFGRTDFVIGGMDLGIHALLSTLYWGGFLIGRFVSSFFSKISARTQLITTSSLATLLAIISMFTQNLWFLVAIGLLHSSMWSCIYTLSIRGLQKYTSKASGLFVSAVFGGALLALLQGGLADFFGSWRWTWILTVVCELVMLYYALWGSRMKETENLKQISS
ncbi:MAG: MFS transporter [Candidatus Symbiothrix sp.]|jgi:FHS family L-fucose permease-like MFS transporter|nr:MFS transporter [Candidatus Symbiothrix sp.]